jgi:cation transport regulator ChaC
MSSTPTMSSIAATWILEAQAQIIATATGGRGPNDEYLYNTAAHLAELGLADADLDWLAARVRALTRAAEHGSLGHWLRRRGR